MHWGDNLCPAGHRATDAGMAAVLWLATIRCQPGLVQPTGGWTGEKDEQNMAADQMALKPASSGERKICQNQVFHIFFPFSFFFFFLGFSVQVHCKGSNMHTTVQELSKERSFFLSVGDFGNSFWGPSLCNTH